MMNIQELPNEIIFHIFSYIPEFQGIMKLTNKYFFQLIIKKGYSRKSLVSSISIVAWAVKYFLISRNTVPYYSVKYGYLEVLKYMLEKYHYLKDETLCPLAAKNGHLDCLKYLHNKKYPWDGKTCAYASLNGHLNCLEYAHENGCEWYENTCSNAIMNGHLNCLMYAYDNKCPIEITSCLLWASDNCKDIYKNGHPFDKKNFVSEEKKMQRECLIYIFKKSNLFRCLLDDKSNIFHGCE